MRREGASSRSLVRRRSRAGAEIYLVEGRGGWRLPSSASVDPEELNGILAAEHALDVWTQGVVGQLSPDDEHGPVWVFLHGFFAEGSGKSQHGRWVDDANLSMTKFADGTERALILQVMANPRSRSLPWMRDGWFIEAVDWSRYALGKKAIIVSGCARQTSIRARSFQFRLATSIGDVYFKASPPMFGCESALTAVLSERFPGLVPHVLAIDSARNWMLTRDFGLVSRDRPDAKEITMTFEKLAVTLAAVQRGLVGETAILSQAGCPDLRLSTLPRHFEQLVSRYPKSATSTHGQLFNWELERLRSLPSVIMQLCLELAACGVSDSVINFDVWRGNVVAGRDSALLFDWAESAIGHPFVSLDIMLRDLEAVVVEDADAIAHVRDTYLDCWDLQVSREIAVRSVGAARVIATASRAVYWSRALETEECDPLVASYGDSVTADLRELIAQTSGI